MGTPEREHVHFASRAELRAWLTANADSAPGVWAIVRRQQATEPGPTYDDLVEEALCFGWIDSTQRRRDEEHNEQLLAPRRPGSTWAGTNKVRVERLIAAGLMTPAGQRAIDVAKANGSWALLDAVERGEVPEELAAALDAVPAARAYFDNMPPSARRQHVWLVVSAKRPETRERRVATIVAAAAEGRRAVD